MKTAQRLTPAQRNRAIERLRVLTAGATFVGVSATVGFSWVAAMSNPGTQASAAVSTTNSSTTSSTTTSGTSSSSSTSSTLGTTTIGSTTSGRAHASGGGS
jgi:hypothetical protein